MLHPDSYSALAFATIYLASPDPSSVDLSFVESLPSPDSATLNCTFIHAGAYGSARVMMAEVLEELGRYADAIKFAQSELEVR